MSGANYPISVYNYYSYFNSELCKKKIIILKILDKIIKFVLSDSSPDSFLIWLLSITIN